MEKNTTAPIVIFAYNRPEHIKKTLHYLSENYQAKESDLIVYSDGAKKDEDIEKIGEVRNFLHKVKGFKTVEIVERPNNLGLVKSIKNGVSEVIDAYGNAIVMEDDLITSRNFLVYMNKSLRLYETYTNVFSVNGLLYGSVKIPFYRMHDTYFYMRPTSTGWGTWKDVWKQIKWTINEDDIHKIEEKDFLFFGNDVRKMALANKEKPINSWAIYWIFHHVLNDGLSAYPRISKILHFGDDGTGTNVKRESQIHRPKLDNGDKTNFKFNNTPKLQSFFVHSMYNRLKKYSN